jgi:hypothetical protein
MAVPQLVRDATGANVVGVAGGWIMTLSILLLLYLIFRFYNGKVFQRHKPYKELLDDILYGNVTSITTIKERFKEIEDKNKKKIDEIGVPSL